MLDKQFDFCGVTVRVRSDENLRMREKLNAFEIEPGNADYTIAVNFSEKIDEIDENDAVCYYLKNIRGEEAFEAPYARIAHRGSECEITVIELYKEGYNVASALRDARMHHILLRFDAVILHASYVLVNGEAILFCAPSGMGKSTQAELWRKFRGAKVVNGDRTIVCHTNDSFIAGGIYYSGTSEYCENVTAPIKAIVLLGKAPQSIAASCQGTEAFLRILRECTCTAEFENDLPKLAEFVADVVNGVKILKLDCLPDESAVATLEEILNGS